MRDGRRQEFATPTVRIRVSVSSMHEQLPIDKCQRVSVSAYQRQVIRPSRREVVVGGRTWNVECSCVSST